MYQQRQTNISCHKSSQNLFENLTMHFSKDVVQIIKEKKDLFSVLKLVLDHVQNVNVAVTTS